MSHEYPIALQGGELMKWWDQSFPDSQKRFLVDAALDFAQHRLESHGTAGVDFDEAKWLKTFRESVGSHAELAALVGPCADQELVSALLTLSRREVTRG